LKLIVIIFGCKKEPYPALIEAAKQTWAKDRDVIFMCDEPDDYNMQHVKFRNTLNDLVGTDYDYILKGALSSYFDLDRINTVLSGLPKEKCYFGRPLDYKGIKYTSGCGVIISRDVAEILRQELPETPYDFEDVLCGEILARHNIEITPNEYFIFNSVNDEFPADEWHYRCKMEGGADITRQQNIEIFKRIHKAKTAK